MKYRSRGLEGFHRRLASESFSSLAGLLGGWIPAEQRAELRRSGHRKRTFTPMTTFWNFLAQVLSPNQPCREVVRQVQVARRRRGKFSISSATGTYCLARRRLPETCLQTIWKRMAAQLTKVSTPDMRWLGLRVGLIDGTTVSMPDTPENQALWPQSSTQKPGCGFPVMKLVGLFNLATGAVHALATGNLHNAEHALFVQMWSTLIATFDLLLGDRNFGSFATFAALHVSERFGVFRLHQGRKVDWRKGRRLGKYDRLVTWTKPKNCTWWLPDPIPESVTVRIIKVSIPIKGFRTQVVLLSTNLLDPKLFPAKAIAELYRRRWDVELIFADIKTSMHMDVLRCKSPEMIRRELHMHMIAYNLIRALMFEAAVTCHTPMNRISFKGSCDSLRQWAPHLAAVATKPSLYRRLFRYLLTTMTDDQLPLRPNRSEPRAVKRRPKNYHRLTKPRHLMGNLPHRNRSK